MNSKMKKAIVISLVLSVIVVLAGCAGTENKNENTNTNVNMTASNQSTNENTTTTTTTTTTNVNANSNQSPTQFTDDGENQNGNTSTTTTTLPAEQIAITEVNSNEDAKDFVQMFTAAMGSNDESKLMACCVQNINDIPSQYQNNRNVLHGLLTNDNYRQMFFGVSQSKVDSISSVEKIAIDGNGITTYLIDYTDTSTFNTDSFTENKRMTVRANSDGKVISIDIETVK